MNSPTAAPIMKGNPTAMKAFRPGSNIDIEESPDNLIIRIRPRFRIGRLLAVPVLLLAGLFGMAIFAFANMSAAMEGGNDASGQIFDFVMMLISGAVPLFVAVVMITVAFTKETLIADSERLRYRCTLFGIGPTREYGRAEGSIHDVPRPIFRNSPVHQFFGFAKARLLLIAGGESRSICEDVSDAGAQRVAEALRSKDLID
jgi:hypothetical protein